MRRSRLLQRSRCGSDHPDGLLGALSGARRYPESSGHGRLSAIRAECEALVAPDNTTSSETSLVHAFVGAATTTARFTSPSCASDLARERTEARDTSALQ